MSAASALSAKFFHDEAAAFEKLESIVWPQGPVCPHCGSMSRITRVKGGRIGLRRCGDCKKQFTATVKTVFESSHVKLHLWLQAAHLICSSKKGFSAHQLHRTLGVTYKTAWFMLHRLRAAMASGGLAPLGGDGKVVEADETYQGVKDEVGHRTIRGKPGLASKRTVVALVERGGSVRSFHVDRATKAVVTDIVRANVSREAELHTDESKLYGVVKGHVAAHFQVNHKAGQYVDRGVTTNTIEGVFSIFKRGMKGVYQHCGEKHLHRYLAEFDFRYNHRLALGVGDKERTGRALMGIVGKRLTYRDSSAGHG
jgi:transposase-like protein